MESKILQVVKVILPEDVSLSAVSAILDKQAAMNVVGTLSWDAYNYRPDVHFRIAHSGHHILLKFSVTEKAVRALETRINGEVYKDSCVEFFISFNGKCYYNFEFSCIGTPHVAWGEGRHNRIKLPEAVVGKIRAESSLGDQPFETVEGSFNWELTVLIPTSCFVSDPGISLDGIRASSNFYKCVDELPEPHFVTWNPVGTPQPDYHRPEYFGQIRFADEFQDYPE